MGAVSFQQYQEGLNLKDAFASAISDARDHHGSQMYTGSIAEKSDVVLMSNTVVGLREAHEKANEYLMQDDARVINKWGPAGAIPVSDSEEGLLTETWSVPVKNPDFTDLSTLDLESLLPPSVTKGKKVISVRLLSIENVQYGRPSISTEGGRMVTVYQVKGRGYLEEFATLAEARACATERATNTPHYGSMYQVAEAVTVNSVTRREDNEYVAVVKPVVKKAELELEVTTVPESRDSLKQTGWLFFGMASC